MPEDCVVYIFHVKFSIYLVRLDGLKLLISEFT